MGNAAPRKTTTEAARNNLIGNVLPPAWEYKIGIRDKIATREQTENKGHELENSGRKKSSSPCQTQVG